MSLAATVNHSKHPALAKEWPHGPGQANQTLSPMSMNRAAHAWKAIEAGKEGPVIRLLLQPWSLALEMPQGA